VFAEQVRKGSRFLAILPIAEQLNLSSTRASSGRQPMLIKWPVPVIKNRVQRRQI